MAARWTLVVILVVLLLTQAALAGKKKCIEAATVHVTLGTAYLSEGACAAALAEFLTAESTCKAARAVAEIQHRIGLAYFWEGTTDEAERRLLAALALEESPAARVNLSALYLSLERWADAEREASAALADPTYEGAARAKHSVAYAALMQGRLDVAEARWKDLVAGVPTFCAGWHGLGQVAEERGDREEASRQYSAAAACAPDDEAYQRDAARAADAAPGATP